MFSDTLDARFVCPEFLLRNSVIALMYVYPRRPRRFAFEFSRAAISEDGAFALDGQRAIVPRMSPDESRINAKQVGPSVQI